MCVWVCGCVGGCGRFTSGGSSKGVGVCVGGGGDLLQYPLICKFHLDHISLQQS